MADFSVDPGFGAPEHQDQTPPRLRLAELRTSLMARAARMERSADHCLPLRQEMSKDDRARFRQAIVDCAASVNATVVTPAILFSAAEQAIGTNRCLSKVRVGLQPGTLNPAHDGHLMAALAGVVSEDLDVVLLACGGTVFGKDGVPAHNRRAAMARIAVQERELANWIVVTSIRKQAEDVFASDPVLSPLAGKEPRIRHANFDMAAFVWLFVANPNVIWTYLVGSDKVAAYGKKNERQLLVEILGDSRVQSKVVYFDRPGVEVNPKTDLEPYAWMTDLLNKGVIQRSALRTCFLSSSAIRQALSDGGNMVGAFALDDCLAKGVQSYLASLS